MENEYYQKQNIELLVKHGLETKVLEALREKYVVREVLVVEEKPQNEDKLNGE